MTTITFDTLRFVERLKASDMPEAQAKAIAEAFREAQGEAELATKYDIELLRRDFEEFGQHVRHDIKELESRMTIRLGSLVVIGVGVIVALGKLPL